MGTSKRILHLRTVTGKGGGPEKTILNSPRFIGPGFEMRLAYLRPRHDTEYDLPSRARALGVQLIDIPESGPVDFRALRQLAWAIRTFQPHILHAHDYKTNLLAVMFRRRSNAAAVTTMHGNVEQTRRLNLYYRFDRWTLPRIDHVLTVSPDLQQTALSLGVDPTRCSLVENGIDADHFRRQSDGSAIRSRFGLPLHGTIIGAIGRLSEEKGFDVLISAVHSVLRDGHDVHLIIVGDGNQRARLLKLISSLGCTDRIQLLGYRRDIIDLYHCLDVFALSSLREGLPNVLLEAMAMEVPIVATRIAGVPDVIQDSHNGLLVEPGSVSALASALTILTVDAAFRRKLSAAARTVVEQQFSLSQRMRKVRAIYDKLLAERDRRRTRVAAP